MSELVRDGVRLWHTDTGAGDPPLLFIHGWCCDHTYFAPQLEQFAQRHRVVALDLRGHGESDKPEQDYTVAAFADDVLALVDELGLEGVVLVGHSLGGIVALDAAVRRPDLIAAAVLVDPSPIVRPPGLDEAAHPFIDALRGPSYAAAARQHATEMLGASEDVADAMCATPQHVMASAMAEIFRWDGVAAASACTLPVLQISAASQFGDVGRFRELCAAAEVEQLEDVGHFVQLLAPERVNASIERFLAALNDEGPRRRGPS